jgi:hypothetical protein
MDYIHLVECMRSLRPWGSHERTEGSVLFEMKQRIGLSLISAVAVTLMVWSVPAGASPPARPGSQITVRNLTVLDGEGNPFPVGGELDAGVLACLPSAPPCAIGFADAKGVVHLDVDPKLSYHVFGFARKTGWGCGYVDPATGVEWWFSATSIDVTGAKLARPATFVVAQPNCFHPTVLDGETANPFPAGTAVMQACPVAGGNCVFGGADTNGVVSIALDPAVEYRFTANVTNPPGWDTSCGYTSDGTTFYFFSTTVQGYPSDVDGTTFQINQPNCYEFDVAIHYLDGTETPLPASYGGVLACSATTGCVVGTPDANGHVVMTLDPAVTYTINGMAVNVPGWSCGYDQLPPDLYWFSPFSVTGTPDTANGDTFVIYQPDPSSCTG